MMHTCIQHILVVSIGPVAMVVTILLARLSLSIQKAIQSIHWNKHVWSTVTIALPQIQ